MRYLNLLLLLVITYTAGLSQPAGSIQGRVTDKLTNEALPGATISPRPGAAKVMANNEGYFTISGLRAGTVTLRVSFVGYETLLMNVLVKEGQMTMADAVLVPFIPAGNEVVISASRRAETIRHAPASVSIISSRELERFPGSNFMELLANTKGIEFVRAGVDYIAVNARGFNTAFNNKVFQIIDGRNTMSPLSNGLPLSNNSTLIREDIATTEVILGPQSALYGPNVHNALIYTTTKDPRLFPGTTVAVTAGNQNQFSARLRQATVINNNWAFKIAGEYAFGQEFIFYDSVYAGGGFYGPLVAIPERNVDFDFRHIRGTAAIHYQAAPKTEIILSAGGSNNHFIGVTGAGRNQMKGVQNSFVQARLIHPDFFINICHARGRIGHSYTIAGYTRDFWNRTHSLLTSGPAARLLPDPAELFALRLGNKFKEQGQRFNAEGQYNHRFQKAGLILVTGLSFQQENPESYGVTLMDAEKRIHVTQIGAVMQLEKSLPWGMRLIGAARNDHHSNFGNFISPKLAWVKKIDNGSFRITWGKAYAMPSILFQYANGNGLVFGNGQGISYIPNFSKFSDPLSVKRTIPLKPEQVSTWEVGYKGTIAKKYFIDISYYNGLSKNFLSPGQSVGGRALSSGDIPLLHNPATAGTVINDTLRNASFTSYFNYGDVRAWGIDAGFDFQFNQKVNLSASYSWFGSGINTDNINNDANKDGYVAADEKSLNAPRNRAVVTLAFQNVWQHRMSVSLSGRWVEQYDFYSGNQLGTAAGKGKRGLVYRGPNLPNLLKNFDHGPLGGFTTIDLRAGYKWNEMISLQLGITNLFNTQQLEFVGSPPIGRLISLEIKVQVPETKKKL